MPPSPPLLSIVVPTRNEAESLPVLLARLVSALGGTGLEVCVVDDSDDDTPAVIERLAVEYPGVLRSLLREGDQRRGGLSTAVVAGLRMARGRYVCVIDADLQHPPETIVAMLAAAEAGADLVVASRYVSGGSHGGLDGGVRRVVSRGATVLARLLFAEARRSRDPLSGFFLCRRALVDGVEFRPVGFKVLLELLVLLPGISVTDVPLRFEKRTLGASKATLGQGVQYLRHLRSLVLDVQGSARLWKFGLVGLSGLLIFLPVLALLAGPAGLPDLVAFLPAFLLSVSWNTAVNRLWTFADMRRQHRLLRRGYLSSALISGVLMFAVYAALVGVHWPVVLAALVAAVVAMAGNGISNLGSVRRAPSTWTRVAVDSGVAAALEAVAMRIGADRAFVVPAEADPDAEPSMLRSVVAAAVGARRAFLVTEAASYRPQRRTNIAVRSLVVIPLVHDAQVVAAVVVERIAARGFDQSDLAAAAEAVVGLGEALPDRPAGPVQAGSPPLAGTAAGPTPLGGRL